MIKKIWSYIGKSLYSPVGDSSKISATRISSYFILASILLIAFVYMTIDIVNSIIMWHKGGIYNIPSVSVTIFGLVLGHHLALLGINKYSETKQISNTSNTTPDGSVVNTVINTVVKQPETTVVATAALPPTPQNPADDLGTT
jgi:hypothetical protein